MEDDLKGPRLVCEGNLLFKCERFREAIERHLQALSYLEPESLEMAECLDHLGQEYWRVGDITEALKYSKLSLVIKERIVPESSSLAKTLANIGCIFHERGEYEKAFYLLNGALRIRETIAPSSLDVAITCTNLGLVFMELGRVQEAVGCHQKAQKIKEQLVPGSVTLARTYVNLANVYHAMGQPGKATALLTMAKDLCTSMKHAPPTSLLATIDMNLGNIFFGSGQFEKALRCYQRAVARELAMAPDSLILAEMYVEMARAHEELGSQEEAHQARHKALRIRWEKAPKFVERGLARA